MADQALDNLLEIYRLARDSLLDTVLNSSGVGTKVYANTLLLKVQKQLKKLEQVSAGYSAAEIPKAYKRALNDLYKEYGNKLQMKSPSLFAHLHKEAIETAAREMQYQISSGIKQAGRRASRYINSAMDDALRFEGLKATGVKYASGQTLQQMKDSLKRNLTDQGILSVQYGSGPSAYQVSLDSYADMVARTTTREVGNLARVNQLEYTGHDLVKMTEHYPTCAACAALQGRVYSISGKDKRFPPLSRAFSGGYKTVHPKCRHSVVPYIESLQTPDELQADIAKSNQAFSDSRDQKQIDLYNSQQAKATEARKNLYQYERYKTRMGKEAPQTYQEFMKVKNKPEEWDPLQRKYFTKPLKDAILIEHPEVNLGDFEVLKGIDTRKDINEFLSLRIPQKSVYYSDFASFQNFKYNTKDNTYKLLSGYNAAVEKGDISALVDFDTYRQVAVKVEKDLLGTVAANGTKITDYSTHFIDRIIGQHSAGDPGISGLRKGVSIADVKDALLHPKNIPETTVDYLGRSSTKLENDTCIVHMNQDGLLIQTNPKRKGNSNDNI